MAIINDEKNNGFVSIEDDPKKKVPVVQNEEQATVSATTNLPKETVSNNQQQEDDNTAQKYIQALYTPAPKPVFDTESADYKKRAAKLNAVAQGFSGLSDILSLARGGSVNAPVQNDKVPAYLNSYWNQRENYNKELNNYNQREAERKSLADRIALNQFNTNRNYDLQKGQDADNEKWKQLQFLQKEGYNKWLQDKDIRDSDESKRRWETEMDWKMKLPYINAALDLEKMQSKLSYDKESKAYDLRDENGLLRHTLVGDGDIQKLYSLIVADPKMAESVSGRMRQLKSQFGEGVNLNHMKVIVSEFWDQVPSAETYLKRRDNSQSNDNSNNWDHRPNYPGGPLRIEGQNNQTTPTQQIQKKEDWSMYEVN